MSKTFHKESSRLHRPIETMDSSWKSNASRCADKPVVIHLWGQRQTNRMKLSNSELRKQWRLSVFPSASRPAIAPPSKHAYVRGMMQNCQQTETMLNMWPCFTCYHFFVNKFWCRLHGHLKKKKKLRLNIRTQKDPMVWLMILWYLRMSLV